MVKTSAKTCLAITSAIISLAITSAKMWLLNLPQMFSYSGNNISHNGNNISHVNSNCHIYYILIRRCNMIIYHITRWLYNHKWFNINHNKILIIINICYIQYSLPTIVAKTTVTFNYNWLYLAYNNQIKYYIMKKIFFF